MLEQGLNLPISPIIGYTNNRNFRKLDDLQQGLKTTSVSATNTINLIHYD
jgi:hypothetical protein